MCEQRNDRFVARHEQTASAFHPKEKFNGALNILVIEFSVSSFVREYAQLVPKGSAILTCKRQMEDTASGIVLDQAPVGPVPESGRNKGYVQWREVPGARKKRLPWVRAGSE